MKKILLFILLLNCINKLNAQQDSSTFYNDLGKKAFDEKRYGVAEKLLNKSILFNSKNTDAIQTLALSLVEMKKYPQAITQFKNLYALQPTNNLALEQLVNLCYSGKYYTEAANYAKICIDKKIGTKMNFIVAKSLFSQEDYAVCSKYLEAASKEEPNNAEVPYLMAQIWVEMNQPKKAVEMYKVAISKDTTKTDWYFELANMYVDLNDLKSALPAYEKAMAGKPTLEMKKTIGILYINNGQVEKGMEYLNVVIAKKPMDKTLFEDIGYAYYNTKKYEEAIKYWDEILRIDKQDAKALYMIGIAYQKKGDKEKGSRLCDAAIALDPSLASLKKQEMTPQGMGL